MENELGKNKAKRAYIIVKTIIDKWDPAGLLAMSAPDDEYDSESAEIARLALTPLSNEELGEKIHSHFLYMFGGKDVFKHSLKECKAIAIQINEVLNTKPWECQEKETIQTSESQILEINKKGLLYQDNNGGEGFVDFEECRDNWVNHVINSDGFLNVAEDFKEKTTCVAIRDITSLFFEFYSSPKIRVKIEPKHTFRNCFKLNWKNRYYKKFREIQLKINAVGWSTFDMS